MRLGHFWFKDRARHEIKVGTETARRPPPQFNGQPNDATSTREDDSRVMM